MQANIKYSYIYESYKDLSAFRQVLVLNLLPGIKASVKFFNDKTFLNGIDIQEQSVEYTDEIVKLFKSAFINIEFFGIFTGTRILKQDFVKDKFKFYVYAAFNHSINQWLSYLELEEICKLDQKEKEKGITDIKINPLKRIGVANNDYMDIKQLITNDIYSLLIMPYPDNFMRKGNEKRIIEFQNPLYQEQKIDEEKFPRYLYREVNNFIEKNIPDKYFHTLLAQYVLSNNKKLSDLRMSDLNLFQTFVLKNIKEIAIEFPSEEVAYLAKQKIKLYVRNKFIDFIIYYINI